MITILSETQDSSARCNIKQVTAEENEVPITLTLKKKEKRLQKYGAARCKTSKHRPSHKNSEMTK